MKTPNYHVQAFNGKERILDVVANASYLSQIADNLRGQRVTEVDVQVKLRNPRNVEELASFLDIIKPNFTVI